VNDVYREWVHMCPLVHVTSEIIMSVTIIVFVMVHKMPSGSCVNRGLQPAKLVVERVIISGNRFWSLLHWECTGKTLLTSPILNMFTLGFSHRTCSAGRVAKFVGHVGCEWRPV
jgi:hypothetical protein